jgi:RNase adaptor protein for sRNA GlmZ degradation
LIDRRWHFFFFLPDNTAWLAQWHFHLSTTTTLCSIQESKKKTSVCCNTRNGDRKRKERENNNQLKTLNKASIVYLTFPGNNTLMIERIGQQRKEEAARTDPLSPTQRTVEAIK